MPATAGRVRMPANNRVHSSAALQTHGIWQSAIGYDPYAPATNNTKPESKPDNNAYASFQGLLALARVTGGANSSETRGACKKCGRVGHLTYQCRNFLTLTPLKDDDGDKLPPPQQRNYDPSIETKKESETDDDDDDESSSSDSSIDPEIERIIAERFGKRMSKKVESLKTRSDRDDDGDDDERRKNRSKRRSCGHHRRTRRRRDSDSDDRSSDDDSIEERKRSKRHRKRRRRMHRERRSVLSSDSESSGSSSSSDDDERRGRKEKKRSRGQ